MDQGLGKYLGEEFGRNIECDLRRESKHQKKHACWAAGLALDGICHDASHVSPASMYVDSLDRHECELIVDCTMEESACQIIKQVFILQKVILCMGFFD